MSARELTAKEEMFIKLFNGDIKDTAKKCNISYSYARRLNTKKHIKDAIRHRNDTKTSFIGRGIASREKRQKFWSDVMDGKKKKATMSDRLKASELLGKSEADFTDKVKHEGGVNITVVDNFKKKPK